MQRLCLLVIAAILGAGASQALAQAPQQIETPARTHTVTVTGEGHVDVTPDIAMLRAGVTTEGETAEQATSANSTAMQKVIAALKQAGVPAEMHLYAQGGHAFGLRRTHFPITEWPRLVETWLQTLGMISQ